jgi:hypothetical protein
LLAALRAKVLGRLAIVPRVAASTLLCAMPYPGLLLCRPSGTLEGGHFWRSFGGHRRAATARRPGGRSAVIDSPLQGGVPAGLLWCSPNPAYEFVGGTPTKASETPALPVHESSAKDGANATLVSGRLFGTLEGAIFGGRSAVIDLPLQHVGPAVIRRS